ncbi:MAG: glycogen synthase GlgA [Candidatus Heimdallarchaeaceae archaeon]
MNIAYITAEIAPFSKTGGLGDVSAAFPKAMQEIGHNVIVITPLYKSIDIEKFDIKKVKENLIAKMGEKFVSFDLLVAFLPKSKLPVYFIKNDYLYREGIYTDSDGKDYLDSAYRFLTFNKSVFVTLNHLIYRPDIIHVNDWHTGLIPFYLKTEFREKKIFQKTKTVFTIHNIGYQGIYPLEQIKDANIPEIYLSDDLLGFHGQINFMKAGIVYSDTLSTVSSKYAEEIQTKEFGYGLEEFIQSRKEDLYGIVHGIDLTVWNPKKDPLIVKNYDSKNLKGKEECKSYLQEKLNLEISKEPLIGIVSRLAKQKGLDLVLEKFEEIMNLGVQFILLGTGEVELEKEFKKKEEQYHENCSINIQFDNVLAHQIEAAADMFLMPSVYEPCGLNQMYSMVYGTVPIVRKTGGLSDTVKDYNQETEEGTGFVFENVDAEECFSAIERAVDVYKNEPEKWMRLKRKIMNLDFSWKRAAKQWEKVYQITKTKK